MVASVRGATGGGHEPVTHEPVAQGDDLSELRMARLQRTHLLCVNFTSN